MANLTIQLIEALDGALASPCAILGEDVAATVRSRVVVAAPSMAHALVLGDDDESRDAAEQIVSAVWRGEYPPGSWWATELGRACAGRLAGAPYGERTVTPKTAMMMLGLSKSRLYQLLRDGRLKRCADDNISLSTLLQHLANR